MASKGGQPNPERGIINSEPYFSDLQNQTLELPVIYTRCASHFKNPKVVQTVPTHKNHSKGHPKLLLDLCPTSSLLILFLFMCLKNLLLFIFIFSIRSN